MGAAVGLIRDLLLVMLGAVIGNVLVSHAVDLTPQLEISYGQCKYKHSPEWVWWSPQFGFSGDMAPKCWEGAGSWKLSDRTGFRIGYLDGGRFSTDNLALWGEDGQTYDPTKPCDVKAQRNCLAQFRGHGGMYGASLGLWRSFRLGPVEIRPEAGAFLYHSWFNVDAMAENPGTDKTMEWNHWNSAVGNHYTPYIALPVAIGKFTVRLEWFRNIHELQDCGPSCFGGTNGPMRRIAIALQF